MDHREHLICQAAEATDVVIDQIEADQTPDPVDVTILRVNLTEARRAGIYPGEINAARRTSPQ
ncbi:hypothetical protein [Streptomyces sp. NPDC051569]|uniref:hypothetical protein n=1 Tax=Streptomyces sp. NPDC051569 TaxID=3365661 RepID=UPI003789BB5C